MDYINLEEQPFDVGVTRARNRAIRKQLAAMTSGEVC